MVIKLGEKIHVIVRRNFENDLRRHFIGKVLETTDSLIRVEGYVFVMNLSSKQFIRRPEKRIRIFGLQDSGNIINILPPEADIEQVKYTLSSVDRLSEQRLVVTDGKTFALDINEFGLAN